MHPPTFKIWFPHQKIHAAQKMHASLPLCTPFQIDFIEDIVSSSQIFEYKRKKDSQETQGILVKTYTKTFRTSL